MYLDFIMMFAIGVFIISTTGYIAVTLKEKIYLSNNMVVLNDKSIPQKALDNVETRRFSIGKTEMMTGDEIKIYSKNFAIIKGTVIGANIREKTILLSVNKLGLKEVGIAGISKIKIISRYGKFLRSF